MRPSIKKDRLAPGVLEELLEAGFVELGSSRMIGPQDRVFAVQAASDFTVRLRSLGRHHMLTTDQPGLLEKYVDYVCYQVETNESLNNVIRKAGLREYLSTGQILSQYVVGHRWPGWVASFLEAPIAGRILGGARGCGRAGPTRRATGETS